MNMTIHHTRNALSGIFGAVLLALFFIGSQGAGAQVTRVHTLESLCGKTVASSLKATGKVVKIAYKGEPSLLPDHPAAVAVRTAIADGKSTILVETLFALSRPRPTDPAGAAAELAAIYGHLRSVGSLEGIEYWSASRNELRIFYAESYRIEAPENRKRLPDIAYPLPGQIPPREYLFAFQRDLSFGSNVYRFDYTASGDSFVVTQTNLTRMNYGIIPVMAPGALSTRLFVVRAEDAIIFYAESGAEASGIFKSKLEVSFSNRAEALFRWFEAKMGK